MEFFKIRRVIPFMRYALVFNVISAITFVLAVAVCFLFAAAGSTRWAATASRARFMR